MKNLNQVLICYFICGCVLKLCLGRHERKQFQGATGRIINLNYNANKQWLDNIRARVIAVDMLATQMTTSYKEIICVTSCTIKHLADKKY
jgi:hypothetical protein